MFDAKYFSERLQEDIREMPCAAVTVFLNGGARFLAHRVLATEAGYAVFEVYRIEDGDPVGHVRWLERMKQRGADVRRERIALPYDTISHVQVSPCEPRDLATVGFTSG